MIQRRVKAGEAVPMDSHCAEGEQCNLKANAEFLTTENTEEHSGVDAGDADVKAKRHCCYLYIGPAEKVCKVLAEEAPPRTED